MSDDPPDPQGARIPPWPVFQRMARSFIRELEKKYELDGDNPLDVWEAIDWAYRAEIKLPSWVMSYLGAAAREIVEVREAAETGQFLPKQAERVGRALGFGVKGRGRSSCFGELALREEDERIYFDVMKITEPIIKKTANGKHRFHAGVKLDFAYDIVAREWGVNRSTVVRACARVLERWRKRVPVNVKDKRELEFVSSMSAHVRLSLVRMNNGIELAEAARREDEEAAENQGAGKEGGEKQQ